MNSVALSTNFFTKQLRILSVVVALPIFLFLPTPIHAAALGGTSNPRVCVDLSYNLSRGSTDAVTSGEVSRLQRFLGLGPSGSFGPITQEAVGQWQHARGIVSPGAAGYSTVGPLTRRAMGCAGAADSSVPPIRTTSAGASNQIPKIWFNPPEAKKRTEVKGFPLNDYYSLFSNEEAWEEVLPHIAVFGLSPLSGATMDPADMRVIFSFLKKHNIALSVGAHVVRSRDTDADRCGRGEGYGGVDPIKPLVKTLKRIKDAGGDVAYIDMDEPMWYGHEDRGIVSPSLGVFVEGCHHSPEAIAKDAAAAYFAAKEIFPNIQMNQSEPILGNEDTRAIDNKGATLSGSEWVASLKAYLEAYKKETGIPLHLLRADIQWH